MTSHHQTTEIVPIAFRDISDLAGEPELLRKKAKGRLPSLSRMAIEDARLLAEAMAEWKPYHAIISDSWDDFCVTFTGHPADIIDQLCRAVVANPSQKVTLPPPALVMDETAKAKKIGRPKKDDPPDKGANGTFKKGSNKAATIAARLKRDHKDIADAVSRGEFKSMRAAAIAAGIVKVKTPLDQLRHWWDKASAAERDRFVAFIGKP